MARIFVDTSAAPSDSGYLSDPDTSTVEFDTGRLFRPVEEGEVLPPDMRNPTATLLTASRALLSLATSTRVQKAPLSTAYLEICRFCYVCGGMVVRLAYDDQVRTIEEALERLQLVVNAAGSANSYAKAQLSTVSALGPLLGIAAGAARGGLPGAASAAVKELASQLIMSLLKSVSTPDQPEITADVLENIRAASAYMSPSGGLDGCIPSNTDASIPTPHSVVTRMNAFAGSDAGVFLAQFPALENLSCRYDQFSDDELLALSFLTPSSLRESVFSRVAVGLIGLLYRTAVTHEPTALKDALRTLKRLELNEAVNQALDPLAFGRGTLIMQVLFAAHEAEEGSPAQYLNRALKGMVDDSARYMDHMSQLDTGSEALVGPSRSTLRDISAHPKVHRPLLRRQQPLRGNDMAEGQILILAELLFPEIVRAAYAADAQPSDIADLDALLAPARELASRVGPLSVWQFLVTIGRPAAVNALFPGYSETDIGTRFFGRQRS